MTSCPERESFSELQPSLAGALLGLFMGESGMLERFHDPHRDLCHAGIGFVSVHDAGGGEWRVFPPCEMNRERGMGSSVAIKEKGSES